MHNTSVLNVLQQLLTIALTRYLITYYNKSQIFIDAEGNSLIAREKERMARLSQKDSFFC